MSDFDAKFMQDEELRSLLRQWSAPGVPNSLDERVAVTYQQMMKSPAALNSTLHSQRNSEVVAMKFCSTCQEEFADRFSFCPVDGTPLSVVSAAAPATSNAAVREIETAYPAPESATNRGVAEPEYFEAATTGTPASAQTASAATKVSTANIGEYHLTILEDAGLLSRLADELGEVAHNYQLTWPEFKRDPFGFVKRSVQGYGQMIGRFFAFGDGIGTAASSASV